MNPKIYDLKTDVSWEAFVNFQHMSQNAMPATEFTHRRHLTQYWQCDSQKPHNLTRLKRCSCHAKWGWRSPKCCARHETWKSCFENDAEVSCLSHRMTFGTLWNVLECHEAPRLSRETTLRNFWNLPKWLVFAELVKGTVIVPPLRSFTAVATASGCGWLWSQKQRRANTP